MVVSLSPELKKSYTAEQYLALEVDSDIRSEFRDGEIVEMTGRTPDHNRLSSALNALLWLSLRKQPYSVFVTNQRLWIPAANLYTYPDVMVIADPVGLQPGRKDNPILIAETLSTSTEGYDRGDKFAHYRTIETFQEYVLINQYQLRVEHYVKQGEHQWLFTEYSGLETSFKLSAVPVEIALADLYEAVEFKTT